MPINSNRHWEPAVAIAPVTEDEVYCDSGTVCEWSCDLHTTQQAWTADYWNSAGERYAGVLVAEVGEDGDHVVSYGHIHPLDMARAVTAYDIDMLGELDASPTQTSKVQQVWAVVTRDGDWVEWGGVTKDAPNAFPLTVVTR